MDSARSNDSEVVELYLRGDPEATAAVDDWILRAARSFRRRLEGHWDDVLQEVRLEVFRLLKQGRFRGESRLGTYLWPVVAHTCLDHIRSQKQWRWIDLESVEVLELSQHRSADQARRTESRDLLRRVLRALSAECRQVWSMIVAGMSYREIGAKLQVAEGTLRVRALRCRRKARAVRAALLAENGVGSGCSESGDSPPKSG